LSGVLEAVNKQGGGFDEHDRVLVETIATLAAIAIENASLVEALRLQTSRLEAHNEELDAFAHTVAHDLKNPIGLITSLAGLLELDYAGLTEAERQGLARSILRSAHKMDNIIEELLLLAGVRKTTVQAWPLDMLAIIGEAKRRLEDMIEKYQAQITLANVDQWPVVLGYAPWVEEVWVNYISNALKYGGHPSLVELGATIQSDGFVRFWVRDNGPGLSTKDQAQLFTPFTRLSQARARGQGLGLSIVRRIVEKLGGQVGVESQGVPGQGSVFYFTLPVSPHHDSQAGETGGA
jgi:signal transduction histidine kinase